MNFVRRKEQFHLLRDPIKSDKSGLPKAGVISLLLHIALITFLSFNLKPTTPKSELSVYRVTLRPFSSPGNEILQGGSRSDLPGLPATQTTEKPKPEDSRKGKEITPPVKLNQKKTQSKVEKPAKADISLAPKKQKALAKEEESEKALQEAIEGIQRKVAVEDVEKKVASRGTAGEGSGGLPGGSSEQGGSIYPGVVKAKIMKEWALPENLPKEGKGLEAIIVIIIGRNDGKVKKSWVEKSSGNPLYDQMAMRAIKKAEPFPPIPLECPDDTFSIKFTPEKSTK
jgi:TonB family protein